MHLHTQEYIEMHYMQTLLWFSKVVVFLPPGSSVCVLWGRVFGRGLALGLMGGLKAWLRSLPFSLSLSALPPRCCVASLARVCAWRSASTTVKGEAFQRSAWETPTTQNIIQHSVALSCVKCEYVCVSHWTFECKLHLYSHLDRHENGTTCSRG